MEAPPLFREGTTLDRFLMDTMRDHPDATGTFVNLMQSVALVGKLISSRVNRAGLAGMLGATGSRNVQGEVVQKLDVYANETFKYCLEHGGHTCLMVSEEEKEPVQTPSRWHSGRYVVVFDPLDGSSNIDVNATIGSIFGIYRRVSPEGGPADLDDVLRRGEEQVAAGYIIYGSGTVLVLATGRRVDAFTLDPEVGEFFLSHPDIRTPERASMYSCNEAYVQQWSGAVRSWLDQQKDPDRKMSSRYIGSLVADFHRNLMKGGVFLYPGTDKAPTGKLRLLYEGFPLAFIAEAAGGAATDGRDRVLSREARTLHDRTPLVIGCREDVHELTQRMRDGEQP